MMSNHLGYPLALHQPKSLFAIRHVDLSDVRSLHTRLWQSQDRDTTQDFIQRVLKFEEQKRGIGIVVVDNKLSPSTIVAYGQITQWVKCAEISDLMVHPDYRGQGIGTAMIQYLTHYSLTVKASCVELGVAMNNQRALALYQKLGFQDSYTLQLDLGQGTEPVLYLNIDLMPYH
jgi:ribosomal protein S18 acetylase RimI-like enzyme